MSLVPRRVERWLPRGNTLPLDEWDRRHRVLLTVLWAHVVLLETLSVMFGMGATWDRIVDGLAALPFALLAGSHRLPRRGRQLIGAIGLLTCSAVIVHISMGATEAHFHYFAVIALLSMYEDWSLFGVAVAYVLVQHGAMGAMDPNIFDHGGSAWMWAGIHAVAVALAGAANLVTWRLNEDVRRAEARTQRLMTHQALHDELTGLPNRRFVMDELERQLEVVAHRSCAAVLFVDIDHFKRINDALGHDGGDRVMAEIARRLRAAMRATDFVGRTGGDEFVVIARPIHDEHEMRGLAERIIGAMADPVRLDGHTRRVSVSVGGALMHADDPSVREVLARADASMYRAKADGRGRYQLAGDEALAAADREDAVETALSLAPRHHFHLVYQPIVDLADGAIVAIEALMRWCDPELGDVRPDEFIPAAIRSGRVLELGRWALEDACREAVRWEQAYGTITKVYVNVAATQLSHPGFGSVVSHALSSARADGRHLALELTETTLMEGMIADTTLASLARAGVEIVLDDFGSGYSSLGYLSRFPVSLIKLDRSFIATAEVAHRTVILDAVANLAHGLRLPALAEGVETPEQLRTVKARGFDYAQGFLFDRPMPAPDILRRLAGTRPYAALVAAGASGASASAIA